MYRICIAVLVFFCCSMATVNARATTAITTPIPLSEIKNYQDYSPELKSIITEAYRLSQKKLTYLYGSADPKNGGMDCSGTMYYLLRKMKLDEVPRSSSEIYTWVKQEGNLHEVTKQDFNSRELSKLKPGDLLFWTGTYPAHHYPNITHVMMYIGKDAHNEPLMFGSTDGRLYRGKRMWGVSVFDFKLSNQFRGKFVGYSCIPHLTCKR